MKNINMSLEEFNKKDTYTKLSLLTAENPNINAPLRYIITVILSVINFFLTWTMVNTNLPTLWEKFINYTFDNQSYEKLFFIAVATYVAYKTSKAIYALLISFLFTLPTIRFQWKKYKKLEPNTTFFQTFKTLMEDSKLD